MILVEDVLNRMGGVLSSEQSQVFIGRKFGDAGLLLPDLVVRTPKGHLRILADTWRITTGEPYGECIRRRQAMAFKGLISKAFDDALDSVMAVRLAPKTRSAYILADAGHTTKCIARKLNMNENTVHRLLGDAYKQIGQTSYRHPGNQGIGGCCA